TILSTRLSVFPVPAAASTRSVVSSSSRIALRAASSGSGEDSPRSAFFMDLPEGAERRQVGRGELALRARGGGLGASAHGPVVAEGAGLGIDGAGKRCGGEEVHAAGEGLARLLHVERHPEALPLAAPAREEVAGVRDPGREARAAQEDLERQGVERVLDAPPTAQPAGLREPERAAGLVVPDLEGAV